MDALDLLQKAVDAGIYKPDEETRQRLENHRLQIQNHAPSTLHISAEDEALLVNAAREHSMRKQKAELENELARLQREHDALAPALVENQVDELIADDRIPANLRDEVIADLLRDGTRLDNFYRKLPPRPPGADPLENYKTSADFGETDPFPRNP